jgi:hypothetical protein
MSSGAYRRSEAVPAGEPLSRCGRRPPAIFHCVILGVYRIDFGAEMSVWDLAPRPQVSRFASHRLTIKQFDDVVQIPPRMNL